MFLINADLIWNYLHLLELLKFLICYYLLVAKQTFLSKN